MKVPGERKSGTFMDCMGGGDGCLYNWKTVSEGKNSKI